MKEKKYRCSISVFIMDNPKQKFHILLMRRTIVSLKQINNKKYEVKNKYCTSLYLHSHTFVAMNELSSGFFMKYQTTTIN